MLEEWIRENFVIKINKKGGRRRERTVIYIYIEEYIKISSISMTNKNV